MEADEGRADGTRTSAVARATVACITSCISCITSCISPSAIQPLPATAAVRTADEDVDQPHGDDALVRQEMAVPHRAARPCLPPAD